MKRNIKNTAFLLMLLAALTSATACGNTTGPDETNATDSTATSIPNSDTTVATTGDVTATITGAPETTARPTETGSSTATTSPTTSTDPVDQVVTVKFNGTSCTPSDSSTIRGDGYAIVITKGGTYEISGDLSGGQLRVSVPKTEEVTLILKGFTASCAVSAPLYIESCDKVTIELAAGTVNSLSDAAEYQYAVAGEDKPNACLYSSDDMTIKGSGTLNVTANYKNGIGCKNDLKIKNGIINVTAPNNILKGNDSVTIEGGKITLSGGEDAIKADTTDRTDKGFILITGDAEVEINCLDDALQATQSITVTTGATVTGTAGGDVTNCTGAVNCDEGAVTVVSTAT